MNRDRFILLVSIVCFGLLAAGSFAAAPPDANEAGRHMEQMAGALKVGDFQTAVSKGLQAEGAFEKIGMAREQVAALIQLASACQSLGHYQQAMEMLNKALGVAKGSGDRKQAALVLSRLGNGHMLTNRLPEAEKALGEAITTAREHGDTDLAASVLNYTGNLRVLQQKYGEAIEAYREAMEISEKAGLQLLAARCAANEGRASLLKGDLSSAATFLGSAHKKHSALPDSHDKAYGLVSIGRMYRNMSLISSKEQERLRDSASRALKEALEVAVNVGAHLSASYAAGYLGEVYEDAGRYDEAGSQTRRAIFEAQIAGAPESMYRWHWQNGRLMEAQVKPVEAISAYRRAVVTLQSIRYEFSGDCRIYNQLSYKDAIEPVYLGLVDQLLKYAASLTDSAQTEPLILEAIQNVELLRTAELQDYFQNSCVAAKKLRIERSDLVSSNRAVVYYIPFQDRLEVLLGLPQGLRQFKVNVDRNKLTTEIREFRRTLEKRTSREYLAHGQKLYEWLIRPFEAELSAQNVETLVFVPDGPLRTIPLAALHDGTDFLIGRYASATTPGLTLIDFYPMQRDKVEVLLTGLSESVQGFPALTYVPYELSTVQQFYRNRALMNGNFRISEMRREIERTPYTIVHIASHGEFSENSLDTYVLTWDEKLNMDQLEKFVGVSRFRRKPVELLALSACQSAATNDRAALGLAGLSVKAGARSALATLWYINDQASSDLVVEFYKQLNDRSLSKAKALQRAQLTLLKGDRYRHPCYWAPFLLVGNWL
jgi:CHAT domain-containing protein